MPKPGAVAPYLFGLRLGLEGVLIIRKLMISKGLASLLVLPTSVEGTLTWYVLFDAASFSRLCSKITKILVLRHHHVRPFLHG